MEPTLKPQSPTGMGQRTQSLSELLSAGQSDGAQDDVEEVEMEEFAPLAASEVKEYSGSHGKVTKAAAEKPQKNDAHGAHSEEHNHDAPAKVDEDHTAKQSTPQRHGKVWLRKILSSSKVTVPAIIMLLGIVLFVSSSEAEESLGLSAVVRGNPMILEVPRSDSRAFIEFKGHIQEHFEEEEGDDDVCISFVLYGQIEENGPYMLVGDDAVFSYKMDHEKETEFIHRFPYHSEAEHDFKRVFINVTTSSEKPLGISLSAINLGELAKYEVLVGGIVLLAVYGIIVSEIMHRAVAAMLGSTLTLGILAFVHVRPSLEEVVSWIDYETCGLLFGMMVMVGIFQRTGFFQVTAVKAFKLSGGRMWPLTVLLLIITMVMAAFIDSVTTMLLMCPITIELFHVLELQPDVAVLAQVMFANIAGTGTPVGNPPNVIVSAHKGAQEGGLDFLTFITRIAPGAILAAIVMLRYYKKGFVKSALAKTKETMTKELHLWRDTAAEMDTKTTEEKEVQQSLLSFADKYEDRMNTLQYERHPNFDDTLKKLEAEYKITDRPMFIKCSVILTVVIIMFFFNKILSLDINPGWVSLLGAMVMLLVCQIHDVEFLLEKIEWGTLVFFAALFVLMRGMEELGVIGWIGDQASSLIRAFPTSIQLPAAVFILLWLSGIASAFVDNIPFMTSMIPVCIALSKDPELQLPLLPLLYGLIYGTSMGGNGTLVGSSANVVAVGLLDQQGYKVSFMQFMKFGMPFLFGAQAVATVYILILTWGFGVDNQLTELDPPVAGTICA